MFLYDTISIHFFSVSEVPLKLGSEGHRNAFIEALNVVSTSDFGKNEITELKHWLTFMLGSHRTDTTTLS